ncbi:MAG: hypothetical protein AAFY35_14055 [Pseudomonadota bacterium]
MIRSRYNKLMGIALIYTAIMLVPGVAGWSAAFTFGGALVFNVIFATIAVYGLVLWPAIRFNTVPAWAISLALVALIALSPGWLSQRLLAQQRPEFSEAAKTLPTIRTIEVHARVERRDGVDQDVITSILSGGTVEEVRIRNRRNTQLMTYRLDGGMVQKRFADLDLQSDLLIEISEALDPKFDASWIRWMLRLSTPRLYRGVNVATGEEVFLHHAMGYRIPMRPTAFIAGGGGPRVYTNLTGFHLLPTRWSRLDPERDLRTTFATLFIALGKPIRAPVRPDPEEVFAQAESLLRLDQPLTVQNRGVVRNWAVQLRQNPDPTPQEIEVFGLILDRAELDGRNWQGDDGQVIEGLITSPKLRDAYFHTYIEALITGDDAREDFVEAITRRLFETRLDPELAARHAPEIAAYLTQKFAGPIGREQLETLRASAAFGVDPIALLRQFRGEAWRQDPANRSKMAYVFEWADGPDRRLIAQDIIEAAMKDAPDRANTLKDSADMLREIRLLGFQSEIEELLMLYMSNPETAADPQAAANVALILSDN